MTKERPLPANAAEIVRAVFLVPYDFSVIAGSLDNLKATVPTEIGEISDSFSQNLKNVIRILSLPFQYTSAHVHSLHWQRIHIAESIRARNIEESSRESAALARARARMDTYLTGEGRDFVADDVLVRLLSLIDDPESLATARELTRQGIVLTWSAIEVLTRDAFVFLLNRKPNLSDRLFADPANRKRFAERLDWATLSSYQYDLSSRLGCYLISKSDLNNVKSMRDIYGALFPDAVELQKSLADRRLWNLYQMRNLIVHKRGIIDKQYLESTGDKRAIGDSLCVKPGEVEDHVEAVLAVGTEILRQVAATT